MKRRRSNRPSTDEPYGELHAKNPFYRKPIDFQGLRSRYPDIMTGGSGSLSSDHGKPFKFDWKDKGAVLALTKALLKDSFQLDVDMKEDGYLCPTIPNRTNYLCYLSDLLQCSPLDPRRTQSAERMTVLDIGTGPYAIYAMLGHQLFGWDFICSDVDVDAVAHARSTVERNSKALAGHIRIVSVTANSSLQEAVMGKYLSVGVGRCADDTTDRSLSVEGGSVRHDGDRRAVEGDGPVLQALRPLLLGQQDDGSHEELLQAVMCNPPFYDLTEEIHPSEHTICTGAVHEMRTMGGEVGFIGAIVADSLLLRTRVRWYSSLVGKMQSLKLLKKMLLCEGIPVDHVFTHTLAQGVTYRWVIAWTFNAEAAALVRSTSTKEVIAAAVHLTRGPEDEGMEEGGLMLEEALTVSALLSTTLSTDLLSLRSFVGAWNQLDATALEVNRPCKAAMDRLLLVADGQPSSEDLQSSLSDLLQEDLINTGAALMMVRIHTALADVGSTRGYCSGSSDTATHKRMLTVGGDKQQSVELCSDLITWMALSEADHLLVRYEVVMNSGGPTAAVMDRVRSQIMEVRLRVVTSKEEGLVDSSSNDVILPMIRLEVSMRHTSSSTASEGTTSSCRKPLNAIFLQHFKLHLLRDNRRWRRQLRLAVH